MGYILAAVMGAMMAGAAQIILELYKRSADRRGIASAVAGEISAIMFSAENRKHVQRFSAIAAALRSAHPPAPPYAIWDHTVKSTTPILDAYIDRIGILGGRLPQRVAHFYSLLSGADIKTRMIASGIYDAKPAAAAIEFDSHLIFWNQAVLEGKRLIEDLQALSGEQPD